MLRRQNSATPFGVNSVLTALNDRLDLEKKLVFSLFGMLGVACFAYVVFDAYYPGALAIFILVGIVGVIAAWIAHQMVFKPIHALSAMAKAVGRGDFSNRLKLPRQDEIGRLALDMDTMCDQLEAAQIAAEAHISALEQLRQADRIATLGRLASSVAHELGNPLNVIELRAQLITSGDVPTLQQAQLSAAVIVEQTRRMTRIINEILSFARVKPPNIARVDIVGVLRKAIALSEHTSKKHGTRILYDGSQAAIELDGDADKLLQIMVNLLVNGAQSMPEGGLLTVSICDRPCAPIDDPSGAVQRYVCIDVTDHGVGIAADLAPKVFEPFFSTKGTEGGTGLGLSVSQGIAREHNGWISVVSKVGSGSTFTLHLPAQRVIESATHGN